MSDEEFYREELRLCELADQLGYSALWIPEHHFDRSYSMCPDNFMFAAHLAARTQHIGLTIAASILPWNSPLRVVEKLNMLDIMAPGRVTLGLGRGLSRLEYETFGLDMNTARDSWLEAADMIYEAMRTGYIHSDGPFHPQPRGQVLPWAGRPLTDRVVNIVMSPESAAIAADRGARMATFIFFPIEKHKELFDHYADAFTRAQAGAPSPAPTVAEFMLIHEDEHEARRLAEDHYKRYFFEFMRHYDFIGDHFADMESYKHYANVGAALKDAGLDQAAEDFVAVQPWGTPEQVIEKLRAQLEVVPNLDLTFLTSFGGIPFDVAETTMRLGAEHVFPALAKIRAKAAR